MNCLISYIPWRSTKNTSLIEYGVPKVHAVSLLAGWPSARNWHLLLEATHIPSPAFQCPSCLQEHWVASVSLFKSLQYPLLLPTAGKRLSAFSSLWLHCLITLSRYLDNPG